MTLRGITAIGFDLDNTLYDRDAAMNAWIRSVFPNDPDLAQEAIRLDDSGFIPRRVLYDWLAERVSWTRDWKEVEARYQAEVLPLVSDDDGVTRAVGDLAPRFRLGILTNGSGMFQRLKFGRLQVASCFDPGTVFATGEIGHEKPEARAFAPLIGALGGAPERILFVGDNPRNDIEGAARLGMKTCWIRLAERHSCAVEPDLVLKSVAELPRHLPWT